MTDAVIVSACRTAVGTAYKGTLSETSAFDLAEPVVRELVRRTGIAADLIDDLILGEVMYGGGNIGRHTAVRLGLGSVPGTAVQRQCASSLGAIQYAAAGVMAGMESAVIAGGAHSSSTAPVLSRRIPGTDEIEDKWMSPSHPDTPDAPNRDMSITVGWNAAEIGGVSRADMDAWALRSHQRAVRAQDEGRFAEEIVPIEVVRKDGTTTVFDRDEHPRRDTTAEKLAGLRVLHPEIDGFSITAGNSSGINDAAAAVLVVSAEFAREYGLTPLAVIRGWSSVGVDPVETGLAPAVAIPKALHRAGLKLGDIALFEINEAFAAMCVATTRALGISEEIVNISGSGISLGHPIAASGARMVTTLIGDLRRAGGGLGVAAMCAGGGMGSALVLEAL
ncbi:thiolase family protein [Nocardia jinanensis]|uniref:Probable acetyl-CoA acetyltransferase n=1 Tax=Nocardia jinanensis TaxID=382504 RepID=A0A917RK66_9NOCA|nr:thiolase family protein [Nocardia jinanensis]GGL12447.1 acetyl-CoA acetyltransferase [Nocardia jinanensis]